ncbi:major facilitator superfamily domain-containing protein [Phthorimaea operculella]|nr:major facilitator superfamily domain-containing protein [Phthorimaea operculella]
MSSSSANALGSTKNVAHTYDEAVDLTGHGKYNYFLLATCALISNAVAMDMFAISVVTAAARCDLRLSIETTGILNSVPLAGIVIFAYPWGFYADRRGRRRALLLSTFGGFLFGALSSFAPNWESLLVLKLIGSSFSTASYSLSFTYMGEGTDSMRRRRYLFITNTGNLAAELIFYALAYFILPLNIAIPIPWLGITVSPWRVYNLVVTAPLGIGGVMLLFLYESPKLLASIGKTDEALEVLRKIYRRNGGKGEYSVKALSVEEEACPSKDSFLRTLVKQTVPLFKPPLLWPTMKLYYLLALSAATNNVFLMWYPMVVNLFFKSFSGAGGDEVQSFCARVVSNVSAHVVTSDADYICDDTISSYTMYAGMLLGLTFAIISLAVAAVASYRKLVLIGCYLVSGLGLALVEHINEPVTNMILFTLVQITAVGNGGVASYFVDLYPTAYRGMASSLGMMFMRLVALAGIIIVGPLIVHHCSLTFYCWAVYVASGIGVSLLLPSDKKQYK